MTGLVVARLRAQPGQAVLVAAMSAVLTMTAVLGLAYAQALDESVQRTALLAAAPAARGASVTVESATPPSPDELRSALEPQVSAATWGTPVPGASANALLGSGERQVLVPLVARDGACGHVELVEGRCSTGPGEVVVARSTAGPAGLGVGSRFDVADASAGTSDTAPVLRGLTVVGIYSRALDTDSFWFGRRLSAQVSVGSAIRTGDAVLVGWPTLRTGRWRTMSVGVDVPLDVERLSTERNDRALADVRALQRRGSEQGGRVSTDLPAVLSGAAAERATARAPLPLLALQGLLLAVVVLAYVAAATTDQRRPDVALARLRGQLPSRAARMLVRDLAGVVVVGCVVGGAAGWVLARLAAARWLEPGVRVVVGWPLFAASGACVVVALASVTLTAVPTVREPLVSLLRSVPPRGSAARAGVVDGVVVALCLAGLVTLLGDDASSPTALVVPGLLALAGGLALSHAVVPVAGLLGRRLLRRGRLASGLACTAVSRRPALRRLVAIQTVAVALLVFAAAAGAVAADQRRVAARQQVGAPVVLDVGPVTPRALLDAVAAADPSGRYAAAVMVGRPGSAIGTTTLAVDPQRFVRVALWDGSGHPGVGAPSLGGLQPPAVEPVELRGRRLSTTVDFTWAPFTPRPGEVSGPPPPQGLRRPAHLVVRVADAGGQVRSVDLGALRRGRQQLSGTVPCAGGCRLRVIGLQRDPSDIGTAVLDLTIASVSVDGRPVDLRTGTGWAVTGYDHSTVGARGGLHGRSRSFGSSLLLHRLDAPVTLPALATAGTTGSLYSLGQDADPSLDPRQIVTAPALAGSDQGYQRVGTALRLPGVPSPAVLVSLPEAGELTGPVSSSTDSQVWLAADDPARERAFVQRLGGHGVGVEGRTSVEDVTRAAGRRGTGLSLHLATVVGVVALVLAASVLAVAVATSGRVRAADLAGLRAVGVPQSVVARAAVREQLLVAVVGVVAGALLGSVGAALTLQRNGSGSTLAPHVAAGGPAVVAVVAVSAVVLVGVCLVLGRRLAAQARPELLREAGQ